MGEFSFGREYRIRRQKDIDRVFARRCSVADDVIIIYGCENGQGLPRLAIMASRKLGKSVVRNRWKRLIREVFRLNKHRIPRGVDYVVIPKPGATPDFRTLFRTFPHLAKQLKRRLDRSAKREESGQATSVGVSSSFQEKAEGRESSRETQLSRGLPQTEVDEATRDTTGPTTDRHDLGEDPPGVGFRGLRKITHPIWRVLRLIDAAIGEVLILPVYVYRWTVSPLLGHCCRFEPSCSQYFIQAVRKYGAIVGSLKGLARILRCHPWHPGGYDPP